MTIQCIDAYYSVMAGVILGCYAIGSCFLLKFFVEDITNDLQLLNFEATVSAGNYELLIKRFSNIVQEYATVKECGQSIFNRIARDELFAY